MRKIMEPARELALTERYDVVVAGGGIAGVSAAVAAARQGARVCLLDKEHMLGGLATLGLIAIYLPICDGMGRKVIGGLGEELLRLSLTHNPRSLPPMWRDGGPSYGPVQENSPRYHIEYNPWTYAMLLDELVVSLGIEIRFDTRVCSVAMNSGRIEALIVENKAGRTAIGCGAVVDATGDADLCALAGEEVQVLSDNKRAGWFYRTELGRLRLTINGDPVHLPIAPDSRGYSGVEPGDVTAMSLDGRAITLRRLREIWQEDPTVEPAALPAIPEFRMTRRLVGQVTLHEAQQRQWFEDAVGMFGDWRKSGPVFYLPFGTLHGKTANLLAAGRCISAAPDAWDITRVIPVCALTGEVAGISAAMLCAYEQHVQALDIQALREKLAKAGGLLDRRFSEEA